MKKSCDDCGYMRLQHTNDYFGTISKFCFRPNAEVNLNGRSSYGCYGERLDPFPLDILRGTCGRRGRYFTRKVECNGNR